MSTVGTEKGVLDKPRHAGLFRPGKSGNPKGRPKGSKNKITLLKQSLELQLRDQAAPDMGAVLGKAIELAVKGDRQMIKLLLDKHMTASTSDDAQGAEKVAIQINTSAPVEPKVVTTPSTNDTEE